MFLLKETVFLSAYPLFCVSVRSRLTPICWVFWVLGSWIVTTFRHPQYDCSFHRSRSRSFHLPLSFAPVFYHFMALKSQLISLVAFSLAFLSTPPHSLQSFSFKFGCILQIRNGLIIIVIIFWHWVKRHWYVLYKAFLLYYSIGRAVQGCLWW